MASDRNTAVGHLRLAEGGERPLQLFLTYRLATLNARLNRQAGQLLRRAGQLKIPEWRVIALLASNGPMNGRRIGDIAGLDAGLVSRTFLSLGKRGLIVLRRDEDDRRIAVAALTEAGRALFEKVRPIMAARQERLLGALSGDERTMVFGIIDKLSIAAGDMSISETGS